MIRPEYLHPRKSRKNKRAEIMRWALRIGYSTVAIAVLGMLAIEAINPGGRSNTEHVAAAATAQALNPELLQSELNELSPRLTDAAVEMVIVEKQNGKAVHYMSCSGLVIDEEKSTHMVGNQKVAGYTYIGTTANHCLSDYQGARWRESLNLLVNSPDEITDPLAEQLVTPLAYVPVKDQYGIATDLAIFSFFLPEGARLRRTPLGTRDIQAETGLNQTEEYDTFGFPVVDQNGVGIVVPIAETLSFKKEEPTSRYPDIASFSGLVAGGMSGAGVTDHMGHLIGVIVEENFLFGQIFYVQKIPSTTLKDINLVKQQGRQLP